MTDVAIRVEELAKRYRVGRREERSDTFVGAAAQALLRPWRNLRTLRRLTRFEEGEAEDVVWALRDVCFEVERGEVVGLIGSNGAGKSTLLKILSRITYPTRGRVRLRGRVASLLEVGTGFHPELTGRENVYLNGTLLGMSRGEVDRKFDEIVAFSGVENFVDTPVKKYSSGMTVRLAFSVAAHLEPEILLVDEVLSVGDALFQRKCLGKMDQVASSGRTVIFVSHSMDAVLKLCRRTLLLEGGQLVSSGPSREVIAHYLSCHSGEAYGQADLREHAGRSPGMTPIARAISLRVPATSEEPTALVRTGDEIALELSYDTGALTIDRVQFGVETVTGKRVFTVGTHLGQDAPIRLEGEGLLECRLPAVPLAAGEYSLSVMLGGTRPALHNLDYVTAALRFRVEPEEGHSLLPNQGELAQSSRWTFS